MYNFLYFKIKSYFMSLKACILLPQNKDYYSLEKVADFCFVNLNVKPNIDESIILLLKDLDSNKEYLYQCPIKHIICSPKLKSSSFPKSHKFLNSNIDLYIFIKLDTDKKLKLISQFNTDNF